LLGGTLAWLCAEGRPAIRGWLPAFVPIVLACAAVVGVAAAGLLSVRGRDGVACAATGLAILTAAGAVFSRLYPAVLASSTQASHSLTAGAAAARHRPELVGLTMPGAGRGASLGLSGS
jgi:cytochrome bd-type quinol oxidase subunit 2